MTIPQPQIIRSRRRSLSIEVTPDGEVIVKAPILAPKFMINQFIREKQSWIEKCLTILEKRKPLKRNYTEGEKFLFLGKSYPLHFHDGIKIGFKDDKLYFPKASVFRAKKEMTNWYMQQAKLFITKRVKHHAEKMDAEYSNLVFSDTKSKWGTCFPDNSLQFNWRLIMTPVMVLDYVVIHELTHTTEKNHGTSFWSKVRQYTPAYKQHRKWLNDNAHLLSL